MKLSVSEYIKGIRSAVGSGGFTPSQLYAFLIYATAKTGTLEEFYDFAVKASKSDESDHLLAGVRRQIDAYEDRLALYREYLLPLMAEGEESPRLALPVENPLFHGRYGSRWKLPDGSPLCHEDTKCKVSVPDLATPIFIMNEIDHITDLSLSMWRDFIEDVGERTAQAVGSIVSAPTGGAGAIAMKESAESATELAKQGARVIKQIADNTSRGSGGGDGDNWKSLKWAVYGGLGSVTLLALYKLIRR